VAATALWKNVLRQRIREVLDPLLASFESKMFVRAALEYEAKKVVDSQTGGDGAGALGAPDSVGQPQLSRDPDVPIKQLLKKPWLNRTDNAIAKYIDENPGCVGKQIAEALEINFDHVRRICRVKLRAWGYTNPGGGEGYYPPQN
jgi:hypothetical protein